MPGNETVANNVVRRVLTRAVGDTAYRRTLLDHPDDVLRIEFARSGGPVPEIQFVVVEETDTKRVLRVPVSRSERQFQRALEPLFEFVDSADADVLDRFVRAPREKLEELLGVDFEQNTEVVVRIESEGQRVLVIPHDEFAAISTGPDRPADDQRIRLCPKGVTIVDLCPADCTFTASCGCTISCTSTHEFPTIDPDPTLDASSRDAARKISDLLDE